MKLRKQIKNRAVVVAMLAVVMFCAFSLPQPDVAQASTFSITRYTEIADGVADVDSKGNQFIYKVTMDVGSSDKVYCFIDRGIYSDSCGSSPVIVMFVRDVTNGCEGFSSPQYMNWECSLLGRNGKFGTNNIYQFASDSKKYSVAVFHFSSNKGNFKSAVSRSFTMDYSSILEKCNKSALTSYQVLLDCSQNVQSPYTSYVSECNGDTSEALSGSQDNPISDENIGTLVLKKSKCYWVKDGSMDVSQRVQWANKTDTDFSLTNNKYAITRIEVKIGNRVTYFGDVEHHGTGKKVDNFGKVYPFKYVIATDNPHDFSFKDMLSASKTDLSKYNAAMLEHEYDLYFRVVCGTAYGTSAEWHCGNWTRYRVTDDPKQDGKNESDNGHFNDNGEWEKDKDTDVDSGGIGNVDDKDDLEDDFNHFKDSENWKDWLNKEGLDLDSAKTFIDQVADVPKMIGDLFSFFPDWVKYSFALGFALIPVIIVIKFLRG